MASASCQTPISLTQDGNSEKHVECYTTTDTASKTHVSYESLTTDAPYHTCIVQQLHRPSSENNDNYVDSDRNNEDYIRIVDDDTDNNHDEYLQIVDNDNELQLVDYVRK